MTVYLDCAATTPVDPEVAQTVFTFMTEHYGNAGSRTHEFGAMAKRAVARAREQIATVASASPDEVVFTSGATESNNLAIQGLTEFGREQGKTHIVSTEIEHKAVLEPLERLGKNGFEIDYVSPAPSGSIDAEEVMALLRDDTLLVSVMHVNNETGVLQPISAIAEGLAHHDAFFHVDAAQGFGKDIGTLQHPRIDLISASGHKLNAPKGIGALVGRRRGYRRTPLQPLLVGGGQERGLRPGTLPVHLIAGFGMAAELAVRHAEERVAAAEVFRARALDALRPLSPVIHGSLDSTVPTILSVAFPGLDAEAAMVAVKGLIAVSNGSACTSASYQPSHVLSAMGLGAEEIASTIRLSWCHLTPDPDWPAVLEALQRIR